MVQNGMLASFGEFYKKDYDAFRTKTIRSIATILQGPRTVADSPCAHTYSIDWTFIGLYCTLYRLVEEKRDRNTLHCSSPRARFLLIQEGCMLSSSYLKEASHCEVVMLIS